MWSIWQSDSYQIQNRDRSEISFYIPTGMVKRKCKNCGGRKRLFPGPQH